MLFYYLFLWVLFQNFVLNILKDFKLDTSDRNNCINQDISSVMCFAIPLKEIIDTLCNTLELNQLNGDTANVAFKQLSVMVS